MFGMKANPCWHFSLCLLVWLVIEALEQDLPCITLPRLISTILVYDIGQELTHFAQEQEHTMADAPRDEDTSNPFFPQMDQLNPAHLHSLTPDFTPDWALAQFLDLPRAH
jgi:hypothetical protein